MPTAVGVVTVTDPHEPLAGQDSDDGLTVAPPVIDRVKVVGHIPVLENAMLVDTGVGTTLEPLKVDGEATSDGAYTAVALTENVFVLYDAALIVMPAPAKPA